MSTILHTLNKSPQNEALRDQLLNTMQDGDALLLLEDGVYYAIGKSLEAFPNACKIYLLKADLHARAIPESDQAELIDYEQFVSLCAQHDKVINWY